MNTAHTPGPWSFSCESVDPDWSIVTAAGGLIVANVNDVNDVIRQQANARAISAVPELLAACQAFVEYEETAEADDGIAMMFSYVALEKAVHAAIAKATGAAA